MINNDNTTCDRHAMHAVSIDRGRMITAAACVIHAAIMTNNNNMVCDRHAMHACVSIDHSRMHDGDATSTWLSQPGGRRGGQLLSLSPG